MKEETITLVVQRQEVSGLREFKKKVTVQWSTTEQPNFNIVAPTKIFASQNNVFTIQALNFGSADPMQIEWTITPEIGKNGATFGNGEFTVQKGALRENTKYTFAVTIFNKDKPNARNKKEVILTTKEAPYGGIIRSNPN